jgi:hypothetical protein
VTPAEAIEAAELAEAETRYRNQVGRLMYEAGRAAGGGTGGRDRVTEPDLITALAAQLEELRGQLARYTGETGQLRARLEEDSGQVMMLRLEIKKLGEKIEAAIARRDAGEPQAPYWPGLGQEEYAAGLAELRTWVERVARVQWPGYMAKLAPCWVNHPEAVWELSNLMTEWARIYGDPGNRSLQDALWFFERWLPGTLGRIGQAVKCDVAGCRLARSSPWERPSPRYT